MLTRLKVSGFKNLLDVDVRFGPFTCVAGANGAGKSNLFDAIHFLSALASKPLDQAALSIRDEDGRFGSVKGLFNRLGDNVTKEMHFEAEMIVPREAVDDLGQTAKASTTLLRYALTLGLKESDSLISGGSLTLLKEELVHIRQSEAHKHLLFQHSAGKWRKSVVTGARRALYISTNQDDSNLIIQLHQDGGSSGRPMPRLAATLPRTVLSVSNAAESPTALVARREMESWRMLHLEPAVLRQSNPFTAPTHMNSKGDHLAATLFSLGKKDPERINSQVVNRLSELIDDIRSLWIDRDDKRDLLTLFVRGRDGTPHPARDLSDGTLRFLALAVLELDPESRGLICLEEPENGIHPERIPAMLNLLQNIAVDPNEPVDEENPLRQVIINTHSPAVVGQIPEDSLLLVESREANYGEGKGGIQAAFSYLENTWRTKDDDDNQNIITKGYLLPYLNPIISTDNLESGKHSSRSESNRNKPRRVVDHPSLQFTLPNIDEAPE